jgi:short-subunit dehydrogenase
VVTRDRYDLNLLILTMSQVVIITGASSGIGKATALHLIEEGYSVYAGARRVEKMQDIVEAGGHVMPLDVTDIDSIQKFVDTVLQQEEHIDVLFNNAGYGLYGAMEDIDVDRARHQFEVNLFGLAEMTKAVLPAMRSQKSGKIINTSSMGGRIYTPLGSWYHATKHALEGWSDCLRLELKTHNIHVIVVQPGMIKTEFGDITSKEMMKSSEEGTRAYKTMTDRITKAIEQSYKTGRIGSSPVVIAKTIAKAIRVRRPATRYVAGQLARPLMFVRKFFGDRVFDWVIMQPFK